MNKRINFFNSRDLLNAFRILFPGDINVTIDLVKKVDKNEVKHAFRQMALEYHPDRARILGVAETELAEKFKDINNAYYLLDAYSEGGRNYINNGVPSFYKKSRNNDVHTDKNLPRTEMLLGQYLLNKGIINLKTLLEAILWQKQSRPCYGEIARGKGILTLDDISVIIKLRERNELIGKAARRLGFISEEQHRMIMDEQSSLQRRIGEYFVEKGILTEEKIMELDQEKKEHNEKIRRMNIDKGYYH